MNIIDFSTSISKYLYFLPKLFCVLLLISTTGCSSTKQLSQSQIQIDKAAIISAMKVQEKDWNNADIDAFMESYWKSEDLSFISSRGPNYGWNETKANYKKGYPTKEAMGKLKFDIIKLDPVSADAYYMIGKYTLTRANDMPTGHFTLLWRHIDGKWLITSDHTSGT